MSDDLDALRPWATPLDLQKIEAINAHGSERAASIALGMHYDAVSKAMRRLKARAAKAGYSPQHDMTHAVPEGFAVKGVSTYYNSQGVAVGQWVKSTADHEAREAALRAAVEALSEDIPRAAPIAPPRPAPTHLLNLYTLTDSHVGALAWHREGGEDWDLSIAEQTLAGCFAALIDSSPAAAVGIVNQLGDFLHLDGLDAVTPTSKHLLDTDGRFEKVVEVAVRILRRVIDMALAKHERVHVLMCEGNHDIASSVWLRTIFSALYENEPRVTVERSPLPYYAYQHGKTMLAFHHGHLRKTDYLDRLFAAQFPVMWGETARRYAHTGHLHHEVVREYLGMKVTQHPTLAARDSYAARGGWMGDRQATAFCYHAEHGQVASVTVSPDMLA